MSDQNTPAAEPVAAKEKSITVQIVRGYFPESGKRLAPGTIVDLPVKVAQKLINSGAAKFPEDDEA